MTRSVPATFAALFALLLPTLAAAEADDDAHLSELEGLRVLHAWTAATDGGAARIFMEIENTGDETAHLTGAMADIGGRVTIFATPPTGDAAPIAVDTVEIYAGTDYDLTPDGLFLELADLAAPLAEGDAFEMEIDFGDLGQVEVHVAVEEADARQHSHAGHSH